MAATTAISLALTTSLSLQLLLLLSTSSSPASAQPCHSSDKKALLRIRSEFGNPPGLASWNTPNSSRCCGWTDVHCNRDGRVDALYLYYENLSGPIAPSIADLTKLDAIRLDGNALTGPIPSFLSRLTSLTYLHLADNRLTGPIPPAISALPLTLLQLERNRLSGPIPDFLARMPLNYLYLFDNQLTGPIPPSFSSSPALEIVDLSRNRLTGDPSPLLGGKRPLQQLLLGGNAFAFNLTGASLPENLTALDLSRNKIYGGVPAGITKLRELTSLNLTYNLLCGEIPSGRWVRRFRASAFEHNKCLCGAPLPACR